MEKHEYICGYCGKSYVPTRRRVQKYCSNSCRSQAYKLRSAEKKQSSEKRNLPTTQNNVETVQAEVVQEAVRTHLEILAGRSPKNMSRGGVLDAAAGKLLADGVRAAGQYIFGSESAELKTLKAIQEKVDKLRSDLIPQDLLVKLGMKEAVLMKGAGGRDISVPFDVVLHQPTRTILYYHSKYGYIYRDEVKGGFEYLPFDPIELGRKAEK